MSAVVRPYRFERSFDPPARTPAGAAASPAPVEAEAAPHRYSEDDLQRARDNAAAEARAQALAEYQDANDQRLADALARIADSADEQERSSRDALATATRDAITVAVQLIRTLMPETARRSAALEIEGLLAQVLPDVAGEPELGLSVHPSLADTLGARVAAIAEAKGFTGAIVVRGDTSIAPGDAAVCWPAGDAVRSLDALWQRLEQVLTRTITAFDTSEQAPPPAPPAPTTAAKGDHHGRE